MAEYGRAERKFLTAARDYSRQEQRRFAWCQIPFELQRGKLYRSQHPQVLEAN